VVERYAIRSRFDENVGCKQLIRDSGRLCSNESFMIVVFATKYLVRGSTQSHYQQNDQMFAAILIWRYYSAVIVGRVCMIIRLIQLYEWLYEWPKLEWAY